MKTQLIYCIPLYLFIAGCLLTLLYYFIPVVVLFFQSLKRYFNYILTGFLAISVLYCIIVTIF